MDYVLHVSDELAKDPHCQAFLEAIQEEVNRMGFSAPKYGHMGKKYPQDAHAIDTARQRLSRYDETGNTEECLDAANMCRIERILPSHPKAHFRPQSLKESPGLVFHADGDKFNYTPQEGDYQ